ncbi:MAG: zinc ribbon domain-containing protein [Acidimicrobiales bacterium]
MSVFEQLLDLQQHDTAIDQLHHRRDRLPERAELLAVAEAEAGLAARRAELDEETAALARSQKRLEDEIAIVEAKRSETDAQLYSGTITAPRELQALQDELGALARRTSDLEDELLEVMTAAEPVDEAVALLESEAAAVAVRRAAIEERLASLEGEIDADLADQQQARDAAAAGLPDERVADYEQRRRQLGGIAIARLVGTSCGGCHLTMSAMEVDRIRKLSPDEPATCEECGRLLVR